MSTSEADGSGLDHRTAHLLLQAAQYYISGRYAGLCFFVPVAALLLHHGLEMALKAVVLKANPEMPHEKADEYLKNEFGHNLNRLWKEAVRLHPNQQLDELTDLVWRLNEFEKIRYPGFAKSYLASFIVDHYDDRPVKPVPPQGVQQLFLCLEDVDLIMKRLWTVCGFPIEMFKLYARPPQLYFIETAYYCNNRHALYRPTYEMAFLPAKNELHPNNEPREDAPSEV